MAEVKTRKGTETSSFGTPGRSNHDASKFYASKMYSGLNNGNGDVEYRENPIKEEYINKIFCKSSEKMSELPNDSVHIMITSPPYNVGKDYDKDLSLDDYRKLLYRVFKETYRVLVPGGRACINIANLGRKPYLPLHSYIIEDMAEIGYIMRGEIIWDKGSSASPSTAWGSYLKANNPVLRDVHEYILIFCKETYSMQNLHKKKSTITKEEFMEYTKSVWKFAAQRASKVGHPAPFPLDLPSRLIKLYTFENDVVLDPFTGAGTTNVAALELNRRHIGYDVDKKYCDLAENRIMQCKSKLPL
ncbi:MAG: DNA adenine methyltransferase YhdJ [bacterium ADurb.Bin212]|nr:MAG: DNA adenine methyltransferase YhdJ [bacterium ADurb.Bin212]